MAASSTTNMSKAAHAHAQRTSISAHDGATTELTACNVGHGLFGALCRIKHNKDLAQVRYGFTGSLIESSSCVLYEKSCESAQN